MTDIKEIAKGEDKKVRQSQAIVEMVRSEGWRIAFGKTLDFMKDTLNIMNLKDEIDLKAAQKAFKILHAHFEEVYGILLEPEDLDEDLEDDEMYHVLSGDKNRPGELEDKEEY